MNSELTNVLPEHLQRTLTREYVLKLGVVILALITTLTGIAGLLLVPTYVFLTQEAVTKQVHLANIESILSSANEIELSTHLATLARDASVLTALKSAPSISTIMRVALAVSHPGITLSGFSYTPAKGTVPGSLDISGTAVSRDALRTYQVALQSAPFASAANLPVSAYAKDTNITFTISVTLAL